MNDKIMTSCYTLPHRLPITEIIGMMVFSFSPVDLNWMLFPLLWGFAPQFFHFNHFLPISFPPYFFAYYGPTSRTISSQVHYFLFILPLLFISLMNNSLFTINSFTCKHVNNTSVCILPFVL